MLDHEDPEERAEGEGGEGTSGLQEGEGLRGEDEVAPQGEEEEVSQRVCVCVCVCEYIMCVHVCKLVCMLFMCA